ncbi:MAG: hypothetical protein ABI298_04545 [Acidimicrobiales bacterium]
MIRGLATFTKNTPGTPDPSRHRSSRSNTRGRRISIREERSKGESGTALILALVYIVAISLIVGALSDWAMNDLSNTKHFNDASSINYSATSATEVAIQSIRAYPQIAQTVPGIAWTGECWNVQGGGPSTLSVDGYSMTVWCSTLEKLTSAATRTVTFQTCQSTYTATQCATNPLLTAVVVFDDYPPGGSPVHTVTCSVTCGEGATQQSWIWGPTG